VLPLTGSRAVEAPLARKAAATATRFARVQEAAVYVALAFAVAAPLLAPGLILAVDLAWTPHPHLDEGYWGVDGSIHGIVNQLPLDSLFVGLGTMDAVAVGEKLLLLAIVALAGAGMHAAAAARTRIGGHYAGFLYAVNPFVYDRLYTGEWYLLLGYALLPWAWSAFTAALNGRASPLRFAAYATAIGCASVHMLGLLGLLCVVTLLATARRPARNARAGIAALALAAAGSLYWLLPTPGLDQTIAAVDSRQLSLYASVPDPRFGLASSLAGLYGYWNNSVPIKAHLAGWPVLALAILVLALYGLYLLRRDRRAWAVSAAGLLGFAIALGSAGPTGGIFTFALEHVGLLRAYREPQKAVALVAFSYAFLGAAAVDDLVRWPRGRRRRLVLGVLLCALPLSYGYRTFGGLWGGLRPATFPPSWADARAVLTDDSTRARTLFLPWHGYFALSFAHGRVVANPAVQYFPAPVVASRSIGDPSVPPDSLDVGIQSLLAAAASSHDLGHCLAKLGISHVVLAHEADYAHYGFLERQRDLRVEFRTAGIVVYRNLAPTAFVNASLGSAAGCASRPLPSERVTPAEYRLDSPLPRAGKLVLGVPFDPGWIAGSVAGRPGPAGGIVFAPAAGTRSLRFAGERDYRRNYTIGAAAVLAIGVGALLHRRRRRPPR
jgi:hypothetical protein